MVVRGNTATADTIFLNFKIVDKPKGRKKKAKKEEKEAEAPEKEPTEDK